MDLYFKKSLDDINNSIKLNTSTLWPYYLKIGMANAQGQEDKVNEAIKKALKINPASYVIWSHYLKFLAPRWGGSFELMQAFINDSKIHIKANPNLRMLEGYLYSEAADLQSSAQKYNAADEAYTKALSYGENHAIMG